MMGSLTKRTLAEIDPGIRKLCRAINSFRGLQTSDSCEGHPDRGDKKWLSATEWSVFFEVAHTEAGWFALEFVAWVLHQVNHYDIPRSGEAGFVALLADAFPPHTNGPGTVLYFVVTGSIGSIVANPDRLAESLLKMKKQVYTTKRWAGEPGEPAFDRRQQRAIRRWCPREAGK